MKKQITALIFAVVLVVSVMLSACSGGNSNMPSASEPSSSITSTAPSKVEPIVSVAESSEESSSQEEEETTETQFVRIDADSGLRMRSGAGTDFDVIKTIPYNAYAEIAKSEEENADWLYVLYGGDIGWVSKEFVAYEKKIQSNQVPDWAQVYFDLLNTFPLMRHSEYCGCGENFWGFMETMSGEGNYGTFHIAFRQFPDYDYPVMVSLYALTHSGGMADMIDLIENGKIIRLDWEDPRLDTFFRVEGGQDGPGVSFPLGESIIEFGGDNENLPDVIAWLKIQGAVGESPTLSRPTVQVPAAWQDAYRSRLTKLDESNEVSALLNSYIWQFLYVGVGDLDGDGAPELIYNTYNVDNFRTETYVETFDENSVILLKYYDSSYESIIEGNHVFGLKFDINDNKKLLTNKDIDSIFNQWESK